MARYPRAAGACIIGILMIGGCGSSGTTTARSAAPPSSTSSRATTTTTTTSASATITIHDFAFGAPITVAPGTRVTVKNADMTTHTLAADGGQFDTGNIFEGKSATFLAPTKPGTYKFHCNIHANMHGTLDVAS